MGILSPSAWQAVLTCRYRTWQAALTERPARPESKVEELRLAAEVEDAILAGMHVCERFEAMRGTLQQTLEELEEFLSASLVGEGRLAGRAGKTAIAVRPLALASRCREWPGLDRVERGQLYAHCERLVEREGGCYSALNGRLHHYSLGQEPKTVCVEVSPMAAASGSDPAPALDPVTCEAPAAAGAALLAPSAQLSCAASCGMFAAGMLPFRS